MLADLKKFQNADVDYAFCDTHVDTVFREREREREVVYLVVVTIGWNLNLWLLVSLLE